MSAPTTFYVILALIVAMTVRRFIRGRGFRGMLFGAPIERKVAEIDLGRRGMLSTTVRVYHLELDAAPDVADLALEISSRTIASFSMRSVTLTRSQATALANALYEGADRQPADGVRSG